MAALYYYQVAYLYQGQRGSQVIHSSNPEANLALAKEAAGLLAESLARPDTPRGLEVRVLGILGMSDKLQQWPPITTQGNAAGEANKPADSNPLGQLSIPTAPAVLTNPDDVLTADGLPAVSAAKNYKSEQLQGLAAQLGIPGAADMKFPELRKTVLPALEKALTDRAQQPATI